MKWIDCLVWRIGAGDYVASRSRRASERPRAHAAAPGEKFAAPSPVVRTGHFELNEPAAPNRAGFGTPLSLAAL